MRPIEEILAEHPDDLEAAEKAMAEEMEPFVERYLDSGDVVPLLNMTLAWVFDYLGNLILGVADEAGVLPEGPEQEWVNMQFARKFQQTAMIYGIVAAKKEAESGLVVATPTMPKPEEIAHP